MILRSLSLLAYLGAPALAQDLPLYDASQFGKIVVSSSQSGINAPHYEALIGNSSLELMSDINPDSAIGRLGRAVGKLDILTDTNAYAPCTAFLISGNRLITNNHCVPGVLAHPQIGGNVIAALEFHVGFIRDGIAGQAQTFRVSPVPLETHEALDYTVLKVIGDANADYGALELSAAPPADADPFMIIGHPQGWAQRLSREQCQAATPAVEGNRVLHTCDTMPGSSGSPVIDDDTRQVVALHSAASGGVNLAVPMAQILAASAILRPAEEAPAVDVSAMEAENKALLARLEALEAENERLAAGQGASMPQGKTAKYTSEPISSLREAPMLRALARAVGRLHVKSSFGPASCSAFLIGNSLLMTSLYCVPGAHLGRADSSIQGLTFEVGDRASFEVSTGPIVEANETLGFVILEAAGQPEEIYGVLNLSTERPPQTGQLWMIHHPRSDGLHVSRLGCMAEGASVVSHDFYGTACESWPGSSGAPLIDAATGKVIGINVSAGWYQPGQQTAHTGAPTEAVLARSIVQQSEQLTRARCVTELFWGAWGARKYKNCPQTYD